MTSVKNEVDDCGQGVNESDYSVDVTADDAMVLVEEDSQLGRTSAEMDLTRDGNDLSSFLTNTQYVNYAGYDCAMTSEERYSGEVVGTNRFKVTLVEKATAVGGECGSLSLECNLRLSAVYQLE